jgi:hypothetical protein
MPQNLLALLEQASGNVRATLAALPRVHELLDQTLAVYQRITPLITRREEKLLLGFVGRSAGALLGGFRLAGSGQAQESFSVSRFALENAQYAAHIFTDPEPYKRGEIYLRRDESDEAKRACRNEFGFGRPAQSVKALDQHIGDIMHELYERTIDFGAHPNHWSTLAGIHERSVDGGTEVGVYLMADEPMHLALAVKTACECAVTALNIFRLLRPERFKLVALDREITALEQAIEPAFLQFVGSQERFRRGLLP